MNTHPSAVLLQALEDGEVGVRSRRALETHLVTCERCRDTLGELRGLSRDFSGALARLDRAGEAALARLAARPQSGLTAAVRPARDRAWLRAAAISALLIGAASVAGLSALWLRERLAPLDEAATAVVAPASSGSFTSGFTLTPTTADLRIELVGLAPDSRVMLRLVDDGQVSIDVVASGAPVRFSDQQSGRINVTVDGRADVSVALPRSLGSATVLVDGVVRATRRDATLEVTPAAGGVTVVAGEG